MKKIILIALALVMLTSIVVIPVGATVADNTVQPRWTNASSVNCNIKYVDGVGYAEATVQGKFGTTSITTNIYLYKYVDNDWSYVDELHETRGSMRATESLPFDAEVGEYFKAEYEISVTKGGTTEDIYKTVYYTIGS